ncbi:FecR family protein [Chitinophaga polysaccharea]|uniref:FecR family protein n=1 Tax=Chitinophaga polysaccharea TaxID=1293035 RepID=A0A561P420_9BACT|nr:FecR family protein [Chitinophaga polysaccharea]TWF32845.1 FecR family protein [Chitinophaga polysaccharea]
MPTSKSPYRYQQLLQRWQQRTCSPQEAIELMEYLRNDASNRILLEELQAAFRQVQPGEEVMSSLPINRVREGLLKHIQGAAVVPIQRSRKPGAWLRWSAAAALLAAMALPAGYLLKHQNATPSAKKAIAAAPAAEQRKTVLTLANGQKVELDKAGMAQLAQGNSTIRNQNGQLIYEQTNGGQAALLYNTLTTAPRETYPLVLADGSKIWLNAGSSLHFPAAFTGNERKVELSGEAYFEIATDAHKPFRIQVKQMTVEVLGTHFNINAYTDETTMNTTLLEGAVNIHSGRSSLRLAPGEQSQVSGDGQIKKITGVNTDEIMAWKEGYFKFENTDLTTVLRQFSHWYDVDVVYEGNVKPRKFFGMISRNSTLPNVLKMLNANDITYRIDGRKLIIEGN